MLPSGTVSFNQEISEFRPCLLSCPGPLSPFTQLLPGGWELFRLSSGKTLGNLCLARLFSGVLGGDLLFLSPGVPPKSLPFCLQVQGAVLKFWDFEIHCLCNEESFRERAAKWLS